MPQLGGSTEAINAPTVAPVDQGRTQLSQFNAGGLLSNMANVLPTAISMWGKADLGKAVGGQLDSAISDAQKTMAQQDAAAAGTGGGTPQVPIPDGTHPVAAAAVNQVASQTGVSPGTGAVNDMNNLAVQADKMNSAVNQGQRSMANIELQKMIAARDFINKHPYMAPQALQTLGVASEFAQNLYKTVNYQALNQAQNAMELFKAQQTAAATQGYPVQGMDYKTFMTWAAQPGGWQERQQRASQASQMAETLKNQNEAGNAADMSTAEQVNTLATPGLMDNYRGALNQIVHMQAQPGESPEGLRARQMGQIKFLQAESRQGFKQAMPPNIGDDWLGNHTGWMDTEAKPYLDLLGGGDQATVAKNTLDVVSSLQDAKIKRDFPGLALAKEVTGILHTLNPTKLSLDMTDQAMLKLNGSGLISRAMTMATEGGVDLGQHLPATDSGVGAAYKASSDYIRKQVASATAWAQVPEEGRALLSRHAIDMINSSSNNVTDAGMDQMMTMMADPQFALVSKRQDFIDRFGAPQKAVIGRYYGNLGNSFVSQFPNLADRGKDAEVYHDDDGVMQLKYNGAALTTDQKAGLQMLNVRLKRGVMALQNLEGGTMDDANRWTFGAALGVK